MPGLHHALATAAASEGIHLKLGTPLPWLSGRGHLNELVQREAPARLIAALEEIHRGLNGDAIALGAKRNASPPTPDLFHADSGCLIEVDEVQHSTTARLLTFDHYPSDLVLGFDVVLYRALICEWKAKGDRAFAYKVSTDFPRPGGRQAQRAYNDALRDFLAPTFTGCPVIRIPVPDRNLTSAVQDLKAALAALG